MKFVHRDSYSILSIRLSCKTFLYNLSKDLTVCWSFSYCFCYIIFLFHIILCNILLPNHRAHAIPAEIGKIIEPKSVTDRVKEVDVVAIKVIVSIDSKIVFRVL